MKQLPHLFFASVDSTNKAMWRWIDAGNEPSEAFAIRAGWQSDGKGQGDARWESEKDQNLLFSVILKPLFLEPSRQFMLSKCISLGLRSALQELCPELNVFIKWPNDMFAFMASGSGGKVAGILIENRLAGKSFQYSVAGIGVNLNQPDFSPALPLARSLHMLTGRIFDPLSCMENIVGEIMVQYDLLRSGHWHTLDKAYQEHLLGFGKPVSYAGKTGKFTGIIRGVNRQGHLVMENDTGQLVQYDMKEVQMLFPPA